MHHAPLHFEGVWCVVGERKGGSHPGRGQRGFSALCGARSAARAARGTVRGLAGAVQPAPGSLRWRLWSPLSAFSWGAGWVSAIPIPP